MIADEIFERKRPKRQALIKYGFSQAADGSLCYSEAFMDNTLIAEVVISTLSSAGPLSSSPVRCRALDAETGDEYALINVKSSTGSFVGRARDEYRAILECIAAKCFYEVPFIYDQSNRIVQLVCDRFGVDPDFPFSTAPEAGALRHPVSRKIFGLIMKVSRSRLEAVQGKGTTTDSDDSLEVINIKINPDKLDNLLTEPGMYRCYHMNKKLWVTAALDETIPDERVMELIRESFELTRTPQDRYPFDAGADGASTLDRQYWIIPSNPATYDVAAGFACSGCDTLTWHQRIHVRPGDIVYIYQTNPVASVMWKCEVISCDASVDSTHQAGSRRTHLMYLKRLESYEKGRYSRTWLNAHGIKKTVRGQRRAPSEMVDAIEREHP